MPLILILYLIFHQPIRKVQAIVCPARAPIISSIRDINSQGKAWEISWQDRSLTEDGFRIEANCGCFGRCPGRWQVSANTSYFLAEKDDFKCNEVNFRICATKAGCSDLCSSWQTASLTFAPCLKADINFDAIVNDADYNFYLDCLGCTSSSCSTPLGRKWRYECELADINGDGIVNSLDNIFPACSGTTFCKCRSTPPSPTPSPTPSPRPTPTPMPTVEPGPKQPAILLGMVVRCEGIWADGNCQDPVFFYGDSCGETARTGRPNYTVTWVQGSRSESKLNTETSYGACWFGEPRYTFDEWESPLGDGDGEEVTISIHVQGNVQLRSWFLNVSGSQPGAPLLFAPQQGTFSTPGPNQTLRAKVYRSGDYIWNHLWFLEWGSATPTSTPTTPIPRGDAWIQTEGGDVHAEGSIDAGNMPAGEVFSVRGDQGRGFPGVVSYYGSYAPKFFPAAVSDPEFGWLAKTPAQRNNYEYFWQLLGSPTEDNFDNQNDIVCNSFSYSNDSQAAIDAKFTLPSDCRVVVLVDGDLTIDKDIIVPISVTTTEQNFLAFIVKGNIEIDGDVKNLQGVYIADGEFKTGASDNQFIGEGIFMANKFDLGPGRGRDLGIDNQTEPAEKFVFRPDFLLNAFPGLWTTSYLWQEVAPH